MRTYLTATALVVATALGAPVSAQTIVLVRHAEKADTSADPALSDAGQARAALLASALQGARVSAVITSPLNRTRSTGEPTAKAAGVTALSISMDGGQAAHVARVAAQARAAGPRDTVLIVGHSNTMPEIARALGDPNPQALTECDFDRMTVIQLGPDAPRAVHARYGAPSTSC